MNGTQSLVKGDSRDSMDEGHLLRGTKFYCEGFVKILASREPGKPW